MIRMNEIMSAMQQARRLPAYPPAVQHLNYHGDRRACLGQHMGPNTLGEWLTVVDVDYDEEKDMTRAGLAYGVIQLAEPHRCMRLQKHDPHPWEFNVRHDTADAPIETTWYYCDGTGQASDA